MPSLTRLFANLSLPTPEFDPSSFRMRLVVKELGPEMVFRLSVSF